MEDHAGWKEIFFGRKEVWFLYICGFRTSVVADLCDQLLRQCCVLINHVTSGSFGDLFILFISCFDFLCIHRVVREKLPRLEKVPRMNLRVTASCVYHGLLFTQDGQKMCSVA